MGVGHHHLDTEIHRDLFGGSSHDLHRGLTFRIIGYMETCASQQSKSGARHE